MKITKSQLKQLIKECLVEILIEGIDSEPGVEALVEAARPRSSSGTRKNYDAEVARLEKQRALLDSKPARKSVVSDNLIASMTDDTTMADIFRDTAETTLLEQGMQNKAGPRMSAANRDPAATAVADNELSDLFAGSQNWASLAFSNNNNNDQ